MSARNERMAAILGNVPARDLGFEIAVMAKIEQRRFRRAVAGNVALAAGAALLLALVMPQFALTFDATGWSATLSQLTGNIPVMLALLVAGFAAWRHRPGAEA